VPNVGSGGGTGRPNAVRTGRMVRCPQGVFAKVPGLGATFWALTRVLLLRRGEVVERDRCLFAR
jgi:hypothetical protein